MAYTREEAAELKRLIYFSIAYEDRDRFNQLVDRETEGLVSVDKAEAWREVAADMVRVGKDLAVLELIHEHALLVCLPTIDKIALSTLYNAVERVVRAHREEFTVNLSEWANLVNTFERIKVLAYGLKTVESGDKSI